MSGRKQKGEEQPQDREETHRWTNRQVEESQEAREGESGAGVPRAKCPGGLVLDEDQRPAGCAVRGSLRFGLVWSLRFGGVTPTQHTT